MKKFILFTLFASSIVFLLVLPLGQDMWYHMYRIGAMADELRQSPFQLPIRMLSATYNGYGYGAALYYGDLFLYPPAVLVSLGMDVVTVHRLFIVGIWWGTFGIAWFSMNKILRRKQGSLAFAYFYTVSSYCALNLCVRSAIGESLAMAFLPPVFCSFYGLLYEEAKENRKKYGIWLALGMAAVAYSHMLTLLWCVIILSVWALWEWKRVLKGGRWPEIIKAALLMLGLSASFVLPLLEQMLYQKVQTPTNSEYQKQGFMAYGIEWIDYFIPYEVKKILTEIFNTGWNIENWHPGTIGLFAIVLVICGIYLKKVRRVRFSGRIKGIGYISLAVLLALGIVPLMNLAKEVFSFMQFSWRILPFVTLGLAATGSEMIQKVDNRHGKAAFLISAFLIFGLAVGPRYLYQIIVQAEDYESIRENNPEIYPKYQYSYDPNAADSLYLPEGVWAGVYRERGEVIEASSEKMEYSWARENNKITINIEENPGEAAALELPLYIYKGYSALAESGERLKMDKSADGLVEIDVSGVTGTITVWYEGTLCQMISDYITVLSLVLLCVYVVFRCPKYNNIL